ncbi:abhydrolase domain-containing protein mpaH [Phanerochaete sordida]|uniref:Abhydrolase domain-containing protein mpaH n=1 Tax=Phanerochaete sordida TaxID=48140 RepID=A0A9P3FVM4_9APHY|nr:abhydrolase domain-containing protein mpaH [Phanerochaete sordida]
MTVQIHAVTLPPEPQYPFHICAKRYSHPAFRATGSARITSGGGGAVQPVTLLLLHSTSFHKEIYEPVLEALFALTAGGGRDIREAWAVDCPNHGEAAVWNADVLQTKPFDEYFSCAHYAEAVCHFLEARRDNGEPYVTRSDRLVAVGHSLGGCTAIILSESIPLASLILFDPFLYPGPPNDLVKLRNRLVRQAHVRRDVWHTQDEAKESLRRTAAKGWDERVLDLYVRYGLRAHPHANRSLAPYNGMTLACTREQEATMYRDADGGIKPLEQLTAICQKIPVHVAFGADADVIPRDVQERIIDSRRFASVQWIQNAGHLVPQHVPESVAQFIYDALCSNDQYLARL